MTTRLGTETTMNKPVKEVGEKDVRNEKKKDRALRGKEHGVSEEEEVQWRQGDNESQKAKKRVEGDLVKGVDGNQL